MPYSVWLALIKEFFLKKPSFESNRVLWYSGKVFFASNFPISSWIFIKTHEFSTEKVLTTHKTFSCQVNGFDMTHFMAKRSHVSDLPATLLNS